jgi:hypothetical protein
MATIRLPQDFKEFLKLLKEHDVRYLLIGGYAVGFHGYPRATADMDIWVAIHPENANKGCKQQSKSRIIRLDGVNIGAFGAG